MTTARCVPRGMALVIGGMSVLLVMAAAPVMASNSSTMAASHLTAVVRGHSVTAASILTASPTITATTAKLPPPTTPGRPGVPTATAAAASSTAASSTAMPRGNRPGWKLIFAEDFRTAARRGAFTSTYGVNWFSYNAGTRDTSGHGVYNVAKTTSVSGGVMDIYLHTEKGVHYGNAVVARVRSTGWGQTYGRYSIRMRASAIPGYKALALLWPDSDVWSQGEVDFPEVNALVAGERPRANVYRAGRWQNFTTRVAFVSGWHIYTTEWRPGRLTFLVDGKTVGTTTKDVPTVSMHYVLQYESVIGGNPPPNSAAGHIQVDWVTMYSRS